MCEQSKNSGREGLRGGNGRSKSLALGRECLRVGKKHLIQTPNRYFPPRTPLPCSLFPNAAKGLFAPPFRSRLVEKGKNYLEALKEVESIRLLSCREFAYLFPRSKIWREKLFGITKSFVAHSSTQESPTCPAP